MNTAHFLVTLAAVRTAHNARGGGGRHAALDGHPEASGTAHVLDERAGGCEVATSDDGAGRVGAAEAAACLFITGNIKRDCTLTPAY